MLNPEPKDNANMRYKIERLKNADGEASGWQMVEIGTDGEHNVFTFNDKGILTHYEGYNGAFIPGLNGSYIYKQEISFDDGGKMIEWVDWVHRPEDGVGWAWSKTEYDINGKIIDTDFIID